jgi:hypothetical protein
MEYGRIDSPDAPMNTSIFDAEADSLHVQVTPKPKIFTSSPGSRTTKELEARRYPEEKWQQTLPKLLLMNMQVSIWQSLRVKVSAHHRLQPI